MRPVKIILLLLCMIFIVPKAVSQYTGNTNDGFSYSLACVQDLTGATGFIAGPITGSSTFCAFATEVYSVTVAGANAATTYLWSGPPGSVITSGQGTSTVLITFGITAGNVGVTVANECSALNPSLAVSLGSCQFFTGGNNDGFSSTIGCIQNLNGGSAFLPGPIVGSSTFCSFATEAYSISVSGATSTTTYTWTGPPGSTITSGQGTSSVLVTFAGTAGNISVDIANECSTVNVTTPVTLNSCQFFAGGSNDGFSSVIGCIQNLNGGSGFIPGPIVGSTTFCSFATEAYSITVTGATATTTYTWSGPPGSTITSGQGTNSVLVTFGGTNGTISVVVANECSSINPTLSVTATSCIFYAGGSNDGFAFTTANSIPLPIQLVSFEADVVSSTVELKWTTTTELNNKLFTVERSKDGLRFEPILYLDGAGTSVQTRKYKAIDKEPFSGLSYYRLAQTDFDGTTTYSNIVAVRVNDLQLGVVALYPNPAKSSSTVTVKYGASRDNELQVQCTDASGKMVFIELIRVKEGVNIIELKVPPGQGLFLFNFISQDKSEVFKIVSQ